MAEGARLESVYTGNRIVGSNPTPSASGTPDPVLPLVMALPKTAYWGYFPIKLWTRRRPGEAQFVLSPAFSLELCTFVREHGFAEP